MNSFYHTIFETRKLPNGGLPGGRRFPCLTAVRANALAVRPGVARRVGELTPARAVATRRGLSTPQSIAAD